MKLKVSLLYTFFILLFTQPGFSRHAITQADSIFELRSVIFDTTSLLADTAHINQAMLLYKNIIDTTEDKNIKHEASWKYLQCIFFKGLFGTHEIDLRKGIYSDGLRFAEINGIDDYDTAPVHCWLGILWGYWGEMNGSFASARAGVPGKVRDHAERAVELDSTYLDAGGFRMLGRLHHKVPNIPLLLGWPSKKKAEHYLWKAHKMYPENLFNKLYLAELLLDRNQKSIAIQLLLEIVSEKEIVKGIASDTWIKHKARRILEEHQ